MTSYDILDFSCSVHTIWRISHMYLLWSPSCVLIYCSGLRIMHQKGSFCMDSVVLDVRAFGDFRFRSFILLQWFFLSRFADAFSYLVSFPKQNHIWCGSWDLMGPLLETFYNYFKDERHDSPLKILWKRISEETQRCTQCICQHHQAQEMYHSEYEWSSIGPLLDVLRSLDEERVTQHLKEINSRITRGVYDPVNDSSEVVSVMFEVLILFYQHSFQSLRIYPIRKPY